MPDLLANAPQKNINLVDGSQYLDGPSYGINPYYIPGSVGSSSQYLDRPVPGVSPSTTWDDGNPYNAHNMPGQQEVIDSYASPEIKDDYAQHIQQEQISTAVDQALEGGFSISDYISNHPGASYEDVMAEAAKHSDEWAEKYIDYIGEKEQLNAANQYTASREDTAYQRLVADLKAAGLNPAMMYGSSASPSASGSQGYVKLTEGANSRDISNYDKIKKMLLSYMKYELEKGLGITNSVYKGVDTLTRIIGLFL